MRAHPSWGISVTTSGSKNVMIMKAGRCQGDQQRRRYFNSWSMWPPPQWSPCGAFRDLRISINRTFLRRRYTRLATCPLSSPRRLLVAPQGIWKSQIPGGKKGLKARRPRFYSGLYHEQVVWSCTSRFPALSLSFLTSTEGEQSRCHCQHPFGLHDLQAHCRPHTSVCTYLSFTPDSTPAPLSSAPPYLSYEWQQLSTDPEVGWQPRLLIAVYSLCLRPFPLTPHNTQTGAGPWLIFKRCLWNWVLRLDSTSLT